MCVEQEHAALGGPVATSPRALSAADPINKYALLTLIRSVWSRIDGFLAAILLTVAFAAAFAIAAARRKKPARARR